MLELNNKRMCPQCFATVSLGTDVCPICGKVNEVKNIPEVLPCGTILHGRYVLGKFLGKGGFSITYTAYDSKTDCVVAIKEFFPSGIAKRDRNQTQVTTESRNTAFFKQNMRHFYEEAQILSLLQHPNIVNIYKLFSENGTVYYTMEYLKGYDLRQMLCHKGGRIDEQELVPIIACVSEALQTVHDRGLLHRDIAPDNIFITKDGSVKLIDFGAARDIGNNNQKSFSIILKQGFAPLEQYQRRGNQGPWTDIYALGATMYYCLNGSMPLFASDRISNPTVNVNCSKQLEAVIRKMMEVNIKDRYSSIKEFKPHFLSAVNSIDTSTIEDYEYPESVDSNQNDNKKNIGSIFDFIKKHNINNKAINRSKILSVVNRISKALKSFSLPIILILLLILVLLIAIIIVLLTL